MPDYTHVTSRAIPSERWRTDAVRDNHPRNFKYSYTCWCEKGVDVLQDLRLRRFFFFFSPPARSCRSVTVGTSSSLIPFPGWAEVRLLTHAFSTHSSHERSVSVIWIHEWTLKNATKGRTIVRRATALWLITSPENRAKSTLRLVTRAITWVMKSLRLNNCYLAL